MSCLLFSFLVSCAQFDVVKASGLVPPVMRSYNDNINGDWDLTEGKVMMVDSCTNAQDLVGIIVVAAHSGKRFYVDSVDVFTGVAFPSVSVVINFLQVKLSAQHTDTYNANEVYSFCLHCEASLQFIHSLCQRKLFRECIVKNKCNMMLFSFCNLILICTHTGTSIFPGYTPGDGTGKEYPLGAALEATKNTLIQDSIKLLLDFRVVFDQELGLILKLRDMMICWIHEGFQSFFRKLNDELLKQERAPL
ncbi:unnamed protein product [Lactuca virosa]|uniref:Nodulin homeobox N-terminal domain-containing protein n=1 Tax=Lactuca virosa TaxID=75947 RepID=A0AAU9MM60_9ASTR|nr:unnamed protein product [Lactuca virosa]